MPKRQFVLPRVKLDRAGGASLRQQIYAQVGRAIRQGELPDGARLPSSRALAALLQISRNTVVEAYEQLLEEGLITTRRGSGVRVSHASAEPVPPFQKVRRTMRAAHYPEHVVAFEDPDGTPMYLRVTR